MASSTPLSYTEALQQTPLPTRLHRAQQHYTSRLTQLHTEQAELTRLHSQYRRLRERLAELPRRLRPVQRVPFGPLASFAGHLERTNEWLVLLGGEWWLECTADRARRIADDRLKEVERRQQRVTDEEKRVREWMEEGQRVLGEAGGKRARAAEGAGEDEDDIVEIKEEYREEDEGDEMAKKDEERLRSTANTRLNGTAVSERAAGGMTDAEFDAYWDKLAELEEEEERLEERKTAHDRGAAVQLEAQDESVAIPAIRSPADIYKHMQQAAAAPQQPPHSSQPPQPSVDHTAVTSQHKKRVSFSSAQPAVAVIDPVSTRPLRHPSPAPSLSAAPLRSSTAAATAGVPPPSSNPALAIAFSGAVLERDLVDDSGAGSASGSVAGQQPPVPAKKKLSRFMAERLGVQFDDD